MILGLGANGVETVRTANASTGIVQPFDQFIYAVEIGYHVSFSFVGWDLEARPNAPDCLPARPTASLRIIPIIEWEADAIVFGRCSATYDSPCASNSFHFDPVYQLISIPEQIAVISPWIR